MKKIILGLVLISIVLVSTVTFIIKKPMNQIEENIPIPKKELFEDYYELGEQKLKTMTLDEKISQILLVRVPQKNAEELISKYQFGGYLFFERDFKNLTKEEVINKVNSFQSVSKIPILTAVDEEGGTVVRISSNKNLRSSPFLSPRNLYEEGGMELIKKDTIEKSELLKELGMNLNLAPVVDVTTNESDYMYKRSIGLNATETALFAKTVIETSKGLGVSYTLKHFPGYGNNVDTHNGISKDDRSLENIKEVDLKPFESGIEVGVEAILISHNIVTSIDEENPASLSKKVHDLLREDLNFSGIIITDDLSMGAITNIETPFIKAIQSENDIIITSEPEKTIEEIKKGLEEKKITEEEIDNMVKKILSWKYYKKLL